MGEYDNSFVDKFLAAEKKGSELGEDLVIKEEQ